MLERSIGAIARLACVLSLACGVVVYGQQSTPALQGVVTDPSGAIVPGASVESRGPGGVQRSRADESGHYSLSVQRPGKYAVRVTAKGFGASEKRDVDVGGPITLDFQLAVESDAQVLTVKDDAAAVNTEPTSNGTALVLGEKELAALSDDPDELAQELQALAGPGGGPNGGQIYIDGFTGGNLPPKSSIREVRVNSNPYSTEYDRPGFGRVEIFTKPGTDTIRGQGFFQFNDQYLNSRSPLLTSSTRAPYENRILGLNLSGPIKKQKASFGFDFERRDITENAFVLATTLDSNLMPQTVNQSVVTPQTRTNISPRLDYSINANNTLVVRYQHTAIELDQNGVGSYNLASQGSNQLSSENTVQATETAIINPTLINETRFQYLRSNVTQTGDNSIPTLSVSGAFTGGGVQIGKSGNTTNRWEMTNTTSWTFKTHTIRWGGRLRQSFNDDTSVNNFNGTYIFLGGVGPELDASNQAIANTSINLTALERYRRTLLFQQQGLSAAQIRALGGGASQFTLNAGTPTTEINQFDIGLFYNDDWRLRPNLTFSYGMRYETQTNIHDYRDWAPRVSLAWGIDGGANKAAKTVLRTGFGVFYDRVADTVILNSQRYNGLTQQSYFLQNPDFFPNIPTLSQLAGSASPQQLQMLTRDLQAPRTYQGSIGIDRQINSYFRLSAQYLESRGVHLQNSRNINTPINGVYPFGDAAVRLLTESSGMSRSHQMFISPNLRYKSIFLFGFYALSYGKDNNEGEPADPYNLRAEWGPSSFADIRHRAVIGTSVPLPWRFSINPFLMMNSGTPYTITTGQDTNKDGFTAERPVLLSNVSAASCSMNDQVYAAGFGCFSLNPAAGTAIGRNSARGPSTVTLNMRLNRTWSFGQKGESGMANNGGGPGGGGPGGGGPPPGGGGGMRGGGGPGGGGPGGGGPPPGMFGAASGKKYNLTLSVSARNLLNHPSYAAPSGDLSSPFFGQYRSLAGFGPMGGASTYNRKIDLQLRFQF